MISADEITRFIEPVYRFCVNRTDNRADAEDLAGEIMLYVLDGISKYGITSLDGWVWRIAHNRYARFCAARKNSELFCGDEFLFDIVGEQDAVDETSFEQEYETVFRYLHTLSSEYKNLLVDYYIGDMSVRALSEKYGLSASTVKWRLNVSRQKIRDRIELKSNGGNEMDKVYKRVNWACNSCNGSMDSGKYLSGQVARAICEAAYEAPVTIEEISLKMGLPTMYIEDALPELIYGDAIVKLGNKYAAEFIIFHLNDADKLQGEFGSLINEITDTFASLLDDNADKIAAMDFYGHDFGTKRLGYIALPVMLRKRVNAIKNSLPGLENGAYPTRKDGGYGWFIVQEAKDESDGGDEYMCGCNSSGDDSGVIYWFNIAKYYDNGIYHNGGTKWLTSKHIPSRCVNGRIPDGLLSDEDAVRLLSVNLIVKSDGGYKLNFPCFSREHFDEFCDLFNTDAVDGMLEKLILKIKSTFAGFVPKRLESQINQWVSLYIHSIVGHVTEELISSGVLEKPDKVKPMVNGVVFVEGKYVMI